MASSKHFMAPLDWIKAGLKRTRKENEHPGTKLEPGIHSQLVSLVKENDWDLLLGTFFLLVTELASRSVGARTLFLEWYRFSLLPFVSGLGLPVGPDPLPERFRSSVILVALMGMMVNMGHV